MLIPSFFIQFSAAAFVVLFLRSASRPTYHRISSPSSIRQAIYGSGSKLMVYTYRLSWREVFRRGNTISPSGMNLGEEGDRQRVNGGNIENRQTERIFSSEPFGPFRGVALDVCVEFGGENDVTMHEWRDGGRREGNLFDANITQSSLWPRLIFGLEPAAGLVPEPNDRGTTPPRPPLLSGYLFSLAVLSMDLRASWSSQTRWEGTWKGSARSSMTSFFGCVI